MADKFKYTLLTILICLFTLTLVGCNRANRIKEPKTPKDIRATVDDKQKARLLRRVDRKFANPEAHFQLAKLYQQDGMWIKAERSYRNAYSFDPVHRKAQAGLIKVLIEQGDTDKAANYTELFVNQASNSASNLLELGLAFQQQQLDDLAIRCYQQALTLNPSSAKVTRQIGYYHYAKGDMVLTKEYLMRSFQLDPMQSEVAGVLGRLGVEVKIPRKKSRRSRKLDKIVNDYDKSLKQQ